MIKKSIAFTIAVFLGLGIMAFSIETMDMSSVLFEEDGYEPVVVLELFTLQGCSSCPSADMLLEEAKNNHPDEVFALSYHVDYWNYMGWEDPFSKPVYTKKQTQYNTKFRSHSNYTPQLVVNVDIHLVGSNRQKAFSAVATYRQLKSKNKIDISSVTRENKKIKVQFELAGDVANKLLRAVLVLNERSTSVKRRENRSRVLKNSNIAIAEQYEKAKVGEGSLIIDIPSIADHNDSLSVFLIVENEALAITLWQKR